MKVRAPDEPRRLLLLWNPKAGSADDETQATVVSVMREVADVTVESVEDPGDLVAVLGKHSDRDPVVAGGDGALHRVVAALEERGELGSRTVGLIPLGTGNDLARALAIPLDPGPAARLATTGAHRPMDLLIDDSGGIVVNAVHLGIGAAASRTAAPLKPLLRRFAYGVGGVLTAFRTPGWRLVVHVDGRQVADGKHRILMVGIGNGSTIGGGTPLAPDAQPDDAVADVVVSFAIGPLQRLGYGLLLRRGEHTGHPQVTSVRGKRIVVAGGPVPVAADGELSEPVSSRIWEVRRHAWRITAPAQSGSTPHTGSR
ncbi:MAG: diacylglycerol/lipid kinase family protein [Micromonosporaceae bacterium]